VTVQFDPTDEEIAAFLRELDAISENDPFPLSSCIRRLSGILTKFGPSGAGIAMPG
jgi:hypothetical protein